ncbi:hypothetical protein BU14_0311s0006 [Porphyra umbilicalis]|uniref:Uncharacterized protein n=1 Tax=Porphyra umbilicalis TaxID=2786 RepID=A0A1X6NZW8_PORUM|nr:hypothetical protein BU14_0311s0006 [Porphyra umbilicalis]|eukprot:OSX74066.1 hypothetical protein BU14_0311s0006 [Porphyra umbilicalis]
MGGGRGVGAVRPPPLCYRRRRARAASRGRHGQADGGGVGAPCRRRGGGRAAHGGAEAHPLGGRQACRRQAAVWPTGVDADPPLVVGSFRPRHEPRTFPAGQPRGRRDGHGRHPAACSARLRRAVRSRHGGGPQTMGRRLERPALSPLRPLLLSPRPPIPRSARRPSTLSRPRPSPVVLDVAITAPAPFPAPCSFLHNPSPPSVVHPVPPLTCRAVPPPPPPPLHAPRPNGRPHPRASGGRRPPPRRAARGHCVRRRWQNARPPPPRRGGGGVRARPRAPSPPPRL